ncbi:MAG TPA: hypothetical protein VGO52_01825 [Hyphomonadaceae bacterium]|jgi:Ca2+-binding EF-hand superfamily protein|nr:hypothetical protein [Hyphomonadaceae bacterium]
MTIKSLLAASALAALMAAPALAQQGRPPQRTPEETNAAFTKADANKDGKLDKAEYKAFLPEQFQAMIDDERLAQIVTMRDADKDGFISKAEATAPMQRPPQ